MLTVVAEDIFGSIINHLKAHTPSSWTPYFDWTYQYNWNMIHLPQYAQDIVYMCAMTTEEY